MYAKVTSSKNVLINDVCTVSYNATNCLLFVVLQINFTHIIYGNRITYNVPPESDVISRSEIYEIPVFCLMDRNGDPDEPFEPESLTVPPQYGEGHPDLKLQLFESNSFL